MQMRGVTDERTSTCCKAMCSSHSEAEKLLSPRCSLDQRALHTPWHCDAACSTEYSQLCKYSSVSHLPDNQCQIAMPKLPD